jgi:hypothetical protein
MSHVENDAMPLWDRPIVNGILADDVEERVTPAPGIGDAIE